MKGKVELASVLQMVCNYFSTIYWNFPLIWQFFDGIQDPQQKNLSLPFTIFSFQNIHFCALQHLKILKVMSQQKHSCFIIRQSGLNLWNGAFWHILNALPRKIWRMSGKYIEIRLRHILCPVEKNYKEEQNTFFYVRNVCSEVTKRYNLPKNKRFFSSTRCFRSVYV